jgi:hypothetical protein
MSQIYNVYLTWVFSRPEKSECMCDNVLVICGTPRAFNAYAYMEGHVKEAVDNKYETTSF